MSLTRRAFVLAALVLLLGAAGQWAGEVLAPAWRYPAALLLLALTLEGVLARSLPLDARWALPRHTSLGRRSEIALQLERAGARALAVQVFLPAPRGVRATPVVHTTLLAGESQTVSEPFTPVALGVLQWPAPRARVLGRFGLAWWTRVLPASAPQRVVPDHLQADERRLPGAGEGAATLQRRGHGLELLGLRDYQPGDDLRAMDWKASARRARLIVRDTAEDQHLEIALVLDAGRAGAVQAGALPRLLHFVNVCARFGERAVALGDRLSLVVIAGGVRLPLPGLGGDRGLRRLREALATLAAEPRESDPVAGALAARSLLRHRGMVVWLGDDGSTGFERLAQAARLLAVRHLPLFVQLLDVEVLAERERPARGWLDPYAALAAAQLLGQQQRAAQGLRQLGCEVVSARPEQVETLLLNRYLQLRARRRV
jgi:uncharacterized protein (DUF58 family)